MDIQTLAAAIAVAKKINSTPEYVTAAVEAWLSEHVDPATGYVLDDTLSTQGAAADAKAAGDKISGLKTAITEKDAEINHLHNFVHYEYDTDYDLEPNTSSSSADSIGIKRTGNIFVLNTTVTSGGARIKINGAMQRKALSGSSANADIDNWVGTQLKSGHTYRVWNIPISGTSTGTTPNAISIYKQGQHATIGFAEIINGCYTRTFFCDGTNINIVWHTGSSVTYSNYKTMVLLEDLTEQSVVGNGYLQKAFVQGSLDENGDTTTTTKRLVSEFINIENARINVHTNGQKVAYCLYDSSKTFLINAGWKYADFEVEKIESAVYVRFAASKLNDSAMTTSDLLATFEVLNGLCDTANDAENKSNGCVNTPYTQTLEVIMHRGYNAIAPENTIPAFKLARQMGFSVIETDVQLTSDNVPVILHDGTVDRTSNGTGNINNMTLAEAQALDFGSWKSTMWAGTKIPTFEEMVACCKKIGLDVYIEIKSDSPWTKALITTLVDTVKSYGMINHVTWIAFDSTLLGYVKEAYSKARLGYLASTYTTSNVDTCVGLKTSDNEVFAVTKYDTLSSSVVEYMAENDIPLCVYLIDTEANVTSMQKYASSVITNEFNVAKYIYEKNII